MKQDEREQLTPQKIRDDIIEKIKFDTPWFFFLLALPLIIFLMIASGIMLYGIVVYGAWLHLVYTLPMLLIAIVLGADIVCAVVWSVQRYRIVRSGNYRITEEPVVEIHERSGTDDIDGCLFGFFVRFLSVFPLFVRFRKPLPRFHFSVGGDVAVDNRTVSCCEQGDRFYLVLTNEKKPRILQFYNQLSYRL